MSRGLERSPDLVTARELSQSWLPQAKVGDLNLKNYPGDLQENSSYEMIENHFITTIVKMHSGKEHHTKILNGAEILLHGLKHHPQIPY